MNVLEMTDSELYRIGIKILNDKLGVSEVPRFIRQCKPGKGDYSVDRHKLLANQGDIDTIVERIQEIRKARKVEERKSAERFNAPQSEIRKMTDIEIFEIGLKVLVDKLGVAGYWGFLQQCQEMNRGYPIEHSQIVTKIGSLRYSVDCSTSSDVEERVSWSVKLGTTGAFYGHNDLIKQNRENL